MAGEGQHSFIRGLGDGFYPPLWLKSYDNKINLVAKYIILDSYSETYTPKLDFEYVFGKLNAKVSYSTTERKIDISFQLAARNVHEAKVNLDYCQLLARSVYGVYKEVPAYGTHPDGSYKLPPPGKSPVFDFNDQRTYIINFGTFLRSQPVKIMNFDFSINFDAGVFDYGSTTVAAPVKNTQEALVGFHAGVDPDADAGDTIGNKQHKQWWAGGGKPTAQLSENDYVYHSKSGKVLPKLVNVKLSMQALHRRAVCFGGKGRHGGVGWSLTENLDWPHGTGKDTPSALYCRSDTGVKKQDPEKDPDAEPVWDEDAAKGGTDISEGAASSTADDAEINVSDQARRAADERLKRISDD